MIKMLMMIMDHHDGNLTIVTSSFRCSLFSSRLPSSSDLMVKNLIIVKKKMKKKTEINLSKISLEIQNSPHAHSFFPPLGFSSPPPPPSSPPPPPHPPWHLAWKDQTKIDQASNFVMSLRKSTYLGDFTFL